MKKFGEVYKKKMNEAEQLHEARLVEDFRKIYNSLLEHYNLTAIHDLNEKSQVAFLSELNQYWSEEEGLSDLGRNFLQKRETRLTENSTPLQKKNFLKDKAAILLNETLRQNDVKYKLYSVIDEMYQQVKGENIEDVLSPKMIGDIITEAFAGSLDEFILNIRTELTESAKPEKVKKSVNESMSEDEFHKVVDIMAKQIAATGDLSPEEAEEYVMDQFGDYNGFLRFLEYSPEDESNFRSLMGESIKRVKSKKINESHKPKVFIKKKH